MSILVGVWNKMELFYVVFFICTFSNVQCDICDNSDRVVLEKYEVFLIAFSMFLLFLTTIILSIALYMIRNNKTIYGINLNKKPIYVRQESTQGISVRSYTNTVNELPRNDGSTLTVNSGIVEISGLTEPETPIRLEPKCEKKLPCIKKPLMPIIPTMQKAQMDDIIKQVLLSKRPDRGSTTLRELDALTIQRTPKENINGSTFDDASANLKAPDAINNESDGDELLYANLPTKQNGQSNSREVTSPPKDGDLVDGFANETHVQVTDAQEVYDMLPNPVRCVEESSEYGNIECSPVYDTPPRTSWDKSESSNAILDQDTNYLLLLSKNRHDDRTSYINARNRNTP